MNHTLGRFLLGVTIFAVIATAYDTSCATSIDCIKSDSFFAPGDAGADGNYPPDRDVKVSHLALDLTPDFKQRTFQGTEVFQFKPNGKPVRNLALTL